MDIMNISTQKLKENWGHLFILLFIYSAGASALISSDNFLGYILGIIMVVVIIVMFLVIYIMFILYRLKE